jgi:hypothetical protein
MKTEQLKDLTYITRECEDFEEMTEIISSKRDKKTSINDRDMKIAELIKTKIFEMVR